MGREAAAVSSFRRPSDLARLGANYLLLPFGRAAAAAAVPRVAVGRGGRPLHSCPLESVECVLVVCELGAKIVCLLRVCQSVRVCVGRFASVRAPLIDVRCAGRRWSWGGIVVVAVVVGVGNCGDEHSKLTRQ